MKSISINVPKNGLTLRVSNKNIPTQIIIVVPDNIDIFTQNNHLIFEDNEISMPVIPIITNNGFPPRSLTMETIIDIIKEHGGSVIINEKSTGWKIYDEIAARLGVSIEARKRLTSGTKEPAWRPEVGFARKDLVDKGILKPTEDSGRGIWELHDKFKV